MWSAENLVTSIKKKQSQFLTWTLCIISPLGAWADKTHNIINNDFYASFKQSLSGTHLYGFMVTVQAMESVSQHWNHSDGAPQSIYSFSNLCLSPAPSSKIHPSQDSKEGALLPNSTFIHLFLSLWYWSPTIILILSSGIYPATWFSICVVIIPFLGGFSYSNTA